MQRAIFLVYKSEWIQSNYVFNSPSYSAPQSGYARHQREVIGEPSPAAFQGFLPNYFLPFLPILPFFTLPRLNSLQRAFTDLSRGSLNLLPLLQWPPTTPRPSPSFLIFSNLEMSLIFTSLSVCWCCRQWCPNYAHTQLPLVIVSPCAARLNIKGTHFVSNFEQYSNLISSNIAFHCATRK